MFWLDEPSDEQIRRSLGMSKAEFYDDLGLSLLTVEEEDEKEAEYWDSYYCDYPEEEE